MVTITLYTRQQKRHWCIEQSFGLCGRGRGWDDLEDWHWNMYNIIYETSCQSRFDARCWMLGAHALGRPRGMVWGGRREEGSGWGAHVYLWRIHVDIQQNQYNIVKLKNKIKLWVIKKKKTKLRANYWRSPKLNSTGAGWGKLVANIGGGHINWESEFLTNSPGILMHTKDWETLTLTMLIKLLSGHDIAKSWERMWIPMPLAHCWWEQSSVPQHRALRYLLKVTGSITCRSYFSLYSQETHLQQGTYRGHAQERAQEDTWGSSG